MDSRNDSKELSSSLMAYVNFSPSSSIIASAKYLSKHKLGKPHFDRLITSIGSIVFCCLFKESSRVGGKPYSANSKIKGLKWAGK